jgi:hypothetical protein
VSGQSGNSDALPVNLRAAYQAHQKSLCRAALFSGELATQGIAGGKGGVFT